MKPSFKALHESVLPWLIDRMSTFLGDDEFIDYNVDQVVNDAIMMGYN